MRYALYGLGVSILLVGAASLRAQAPVQEEAKRLRVEMERLQKRIQELEARLKNAPVERKKEVERPAPPRAPAGFGGIARFDSKEMQAQFEKMRAEMEKRFSNFGTGPKGPGSKEIQERRERMRAEFSKQPAAPKESDRKPESRAGRGNPPFGTAPRDFARGGPPFGAGPGGGSPFANAARDRERNAKVDELISRIIKDLEQLRQELKRR